MKTIRPAPLKAGQRVSVVSPAGPVDPAAFQKGIDRLSKKYEVSWTDECLVRQDYLAGSDDQRLTELQNALDDTATRAIFVSRGGFGVSRIIDRLDLSGFLRSPKWVVGSSDLTALSLYLWSKHRIQTIHGPMVARLAQTDNRDANTLFDILEEKPWSQPSELKGACPGNAKGPILGGNLTMLAHMAGTLDPSITEGVILFLEDVGEQPYRLDRCLTQLKRAEILDKIAGVVLGEFTNCETGPHGIGAIEAVIRNLSPLKMPVATSYPAAHGTRNYPFVQGDELSLKVSKDGTVVLI